MTPAKACLRVLVVLVAACALALLAGQAAVAQSDGPADVPLSAAAESANPVVTVAHFAPLGTDVLSTSVTVRINGIDAITDLVYSEVIPGLNLLPAGQYTVEILPTGSPTAVLSGVVTLTVDTRYTFAAIGDGVNQPLTLTALVDDITAHVTGTAKVRLSHFAPFSNTLPGTLVDICDDIAGAPVTGLENIPFGASSPYLPLPAGIYDLSVAAAGSSCANVLLPLDPLAFLPGKIYDIYAIGSNTPAFPLEVASITGLNYPVTAAVAHFAPFGDTVAGTAVDVRVNGTLAFTNVVYNQFVADVQLLPGPTLVEILPAGTATVALSGILTFADGLQYTLAAVGDGANQPLALAVLPDDVTPPLPGNAKVRISHFAPFSNTLAGTLVDICDDKTGLAVPGLTNVPFGTTTPFYLPIPAGVYDLSVGRAGTSCKTVALDVPPIAALAGKTYDIYAIGKGTAAFPLAVTTITGLDYPAEVLLGHFAPFASTITGTNVDIRVNGVVVFTNVAYSEFFAGLQFMPMPNLVEILLPASQARAADVSTVALSGTITLTGGTRYDLLVIGGANSQPLAFSTHVISPTAPAGKALLTLGHLAPFNSDAAVMTVNICTGTGTLLLANVKYGDVAANLVLEPGIYDLKIAARPGCVTTLLDLAPFRLKAGDVGDAFAIGTNPLGEPFPLALVSTTGLRPPWQGYLPYIEK